MAVFKFSSFCKAGDYASDWGCGSLPALDFSDLDATAVE
jgi:hypothetical protein